MLTIENLHFRYGEKSPLFMFDLSAQSGEIIGILGKSGSGKSTLLDLIAGFQKPFMGRLEWQGDDLTQLPPEARPVTILFQSHNLFEHLTALENVALGIDTQLKMSDEVKAKATKALADVGLSGFENKQAQYLSGGQKQRVALARSLARERPILLLDEPFNGLDDETKSECLLLTQRLAKEQNCVVLMITHDVDDCDKIADRIVTVSTDNGTHHLVEIIG